MSRCLGSNPSASATKTSQHRPQRGDHVPADMELAGLEALTPAGERVKLAGFWASRPVVLVLLRHFG